MGGKSAASGGSSSISAEALRKHVEQLTTANRKLECKVDLLTSMVAMKDEMIKTNDERFSALKWEVLNNYHGDDDAFVAMGKALKRSIHGWEGEIVEGTQVIAPLVVARREAVEQRFNTVPRDLAGEALADCLPEFRRDFLLRVVESFGDATPEEVIAACHDAYADVLRKHSRLAAVSRGSTDASIRLGRAANSALVATTQRPNDAAPLLDQEPPLQEPPLQAAETPAAAAKKKTKKSASWFGRSRN